MLSFEYPYLLATILLFIGAKIWLPLRYRSFIFPHLETLNLSSVTQSKWVGFCKWVGIVSAIVALASPVKKESITQDNEGL